MNMRELKASPSLRDSYFNIQRVQTNKLSLNMERKKGS